MVVSIKIITFARQKGGYSIMMKRFIFLLVVFMPVWCAGQLIHSGTATSRFLTSYTSGAANDTVFVFCSPAVASLSAAGSGGTAPYTFKWYYYNSTTHQYPLAPFQTNAGVGSSTAGALASGGYKLVITDATSAVVGCDYAWVWNIDLTVDAGSAISGCGPFSLAGSINTNGNTTSFKYYNPPADQLIIDASTTITVCFTALHTYVSDLAFHLIGPAACGSPDILLSPNPGNNGQSNVCNSNNNVNGLCFTTTAGANFDPCNELGGVNATTTTSNYSGTYSSYGPAGGTHTAINWSGLYGCNASNGGFTLQIWDCVNLDVGALTNTTITFSGAGTCGTATVNYTSGTINSAINDGACSSGTASTYTATYPVLDTTPIIITDVVGFTWTAVPAFTIPNATTSLTPSLNPNPVVNTKFYLTVNGNHGCPKEDSVFYTYVAPTAPSITAVAPLCSNAAAVSLSGNPSGGTFSGSGVSGTSFNPNGLSGAVTISYSTGSGGCLASTTSVINVTSLPVASFSYSGTPYCQNAANPSPTFSGGGVAGTFSSTAGLSIAPSTGVVNLAASTPGTYTVTNFIAAAGACNAVSATASITITVVPVATFSYASGTYCSSGGINAVPVFGSGGVAGTFSSAPAGLTLNAATGVITSASSAVGNYTVTNFIAPAGGCGGTSATASVSIITSQVAAFSYVNDPYCSAGANPIPTFSGGGSAGTFSSTAGLSFVSVSTGEVDLPVTTPGSYTITNTVPATLGCPSSAASTTLNITQLPVATFDYTGNPFCPAAGVVPVHFIGAGQPGIFSSSSVNLIVDINSGDVDITNSLAGTYWVYNLLPAADGCPDVVDSTQVIITNGPVATFSYTGSPYCQGSGNPAPTFSGGGTAGTFSSTPGLNFVSTTTGVVNLSTSTTGTYTVTNTIAAAGGCPAGSATATITIISGNVATFSYTGNPYCQSSANPFPTYSGGGTAGTFTSLPGLIFVSPLTGEINLSASTAGTYTVTNTIAASGSCPQAVATASITITAVPVAIFSYIGTPYCITASNPSPTFSGGGVGGTFTAFPVGLSINPFSGMVTLGSSSAGTYTVTNTVSATGCPDVIATSTIIITALPIASFSYPASPYCQSGGNPSPTFSGGGVAGTFTSSPAGLVLNSSSGLINISASICGSYTVTNTLPAAGGCPQEIATAVVTITCPAVATFSYPASPYCINASNPAPTFSGSGVAGTFSSTAGLDFISTSTGVIDLSTSVPGTYLVTNTIAASGGCGVVSFSSSVTITAVPVATFSYTANPYCQSSINPFPAYSGAGAGGTFTSTAGLNFVSAATGEVNLSASTAGTYTVTNTIVAAGGCPQVSATATITINGTPSAGFSYAGSPYCINASNPAPTFSGGGVAGTFSSTAGLNFISTSTGVIDLSTSAAGTYTVTNTVLAGGCPNVVATATITLTAIPVATFSYAASPYCQSGTNPSPTYTGGGTAGIFTSTPGLSFVSASTGVVDLAASTCGTYTVTNTILASGGCAAATSTSPLTIICTPAATFSYAGSPYCSNASNPVPSYSGGGVAGTFSSSPGLNFVSTSTGEIDLTTSSAGSYMVTNTVLAAGCPDVVATATISLTAIPVATFSYAASPYCQSAVNPSPTYNGGGTAGIFTSSPGLSFVSASSGVIDLAASTCGTYTVTNTILASGGCASVISTSPVTIICTPAATFSYAGSPYCSDASNPVPSYSGGGVAGTFSSSPGLNFVSTSTGEIDLTTSSAGTYTVTNTVVFGGCPNIIATAAITITALPVASFSYVSSPYCQSGTNPMPTFSGGGAAGTFTSTPLGLSIDINTGLITLSSGSGGTYTVTNTIAAGGGCPAVSASSSVTVIAVPAATFSYTLTPYCQNASNPVPTMNGGAVSGIFTSTPGLSIDSITGSINLGLTTTGTYTVTNTVSANGCPDVIATFTIIITALPIASFSFPAPPFCQSGTNPSPLYNGGGVPGVFTSSPIGLSINPFTGLVTLSASGAGVYTVTNTIAASGGCPIVSDTGLITVIALPAATFSYPATPYCQSGINPSPAFSGGGIAGIFTSSAGLVLDSITGIVDLAGSTPGTYTVTNTIAAGACPTVSALSTITITVIPVAAFTYTGSPFCQNAANPSVTYSGGGVAGIFSSAAGLVIDSLTGTVNLALSTPGFYTVTNTIPSFGGCAAVSSTDTLSITAMPIATFSYPSSPFCIGGTNPAPVYIGGGVAGAFSSTAGLVIDGITGIINLTTSATGAYTITNTIAAGTCPAVTASATILISPIPTANAGATQTFSCGTPMLTLDGSLSSSGVNIVFLWTTSNGHIISGNNTTSPVIDSAGTYTLTVTDTAAGCFATSTVVITGSPGPTAAFTANPTTGSPPLTVNFTNTSTGGNSYYWTFGTGDTSVVINPNYIYNTSATYTVTLMVSDSSGCSDTASATILVFDSYSMIAGNAFTPNGDGVNDLYYINLTGVTILEGDIYNRWGVKMFTFHAPKEGWDGRTISGQQAEAGTYFYVVKTIGTDGSDHEDKGFFMLIR